MLIRFTEHGSSKPFVENNSLISKSENGMRHVNEAEGRTKCILHLRLLTSDTTFCARAVFLTRPQDE